MTLLWYAWRPDLLNLWRRLGLGLLYSTPLPAWVGAQLDYPGMKNCSGSGQAFEKDQAGCTAAVSVGAPHAEAAEERTPDTRVAGSARRRRLNSRALLLPSWRGPAPRPRHDTMPSTSILDIGHSRPSIPFFIAEESRYRIPSKYCTITYYTNSNRHRVITSEYHHIPLWCHASQWVSSLALPLSIPR